MFTEWSVDGKENDNFVRNFKFECIFDYTLLYSLSKSLEFLNFLTATRLESALDQARKYQLNEQAELLYWINAIWQEKEELKTKQAYLLEEQLVQLEKEKAEILNKLKSDSLKGQQKLVIFLFSL